LANTGGFTLLHIFAQYGLLKVTNTVVERCADVNEFNIHIFTPIMVAAFPGKLEICHSFTELALIYS
jgi:ankyrin repeat protein